MVGVWFVTDKKTKAQRGEVTHADHSARCGAWIQT